MSTTSNMISVSLTKDEWDTIRIAILSAKGHEVDRNGLTPWRDMLDSAYRALKDQTF